MKKLIKKKGMLLAGMLAFGFCNNANAQWTNLSSGTSSNLYGVHFPNSAIGYAVGDKGTILKTSDTGNTWVTTKMPCSDCWYWDVRFTNKDTGYIVGETDPGTNPGGKGVIYKTTDGGANWINVLFDANTPVRDLFVVNKDTMYACGGAEGIYGKIWKSVDKGNTWTKLSPSYMDAMWGGLCFFDSKTGFLGIYESVFGTINPTGATWLNTSDGGASFGTKLLPPGAPSAGGSSSYWVFASDIANSKVAYMSRGTYVGSDSVYIRKTTDAGKTWKETAIPGYTGSLYGMDFLDVDTGYMIGDKGTIMKTTNAGLNWIKQTSPTTRELRGVYLVHAGLGFAVGQEGVIIRYKTGNQNQQPQDISESFADAKTISLYPNPAKNQLSIEGLDNGVHNITVLDLRGATVLSLLNFKSSTINLETLQPGVYFVRITMEGKIYSAKFIKE